MTDRLARAWRIANLAAVPLVVLQAVAFAMRPVGPDDMAYWLTRSGELYDIGWNERFAFVYSPAFAQAIAPLAILSFPAFHAALVIAQVAALVWLVRPLGAAAYLASPLGMTVIGSGNIDVLLTAAIALEWWPAVLLTKVTPGAGMAYYAGSRQWRRLALILGATAAIVAVSAVLWPGAWVEWLRSLAASTTAQPLGLPVPMWLRLPVAGLVGLWGGLTGRRWTMAIAAGLARPNLGLSALTYLAAVPRLRRPTRWHREDHPSLSTEANGRTVGRPGSVEPA